MKRIIATKQIYEAPAVYDMDGSMVAYLLAGSEPVHGLVEQPGRDGYEQANIEESTADPEEVLAKPHNFFWEMSEDE